jgi:hypothetical protein
LNYYPIYIIVAHPSEARKIKKYLKLKEIDMEIKRWIQAISLKHPCVSLSIGCIFSFILILALCAVGWVVILSTTLCLILPLFLLRLPGETIFDFSTSVAGDVTLIVTVTALSWILMIIGVRILVRLGLFLDGIRRSNTSP